MAGSKKDITRRITRIALFSAILFAQEELLTSIPNIQFTQCLIAIYFFSFGFTDTLIIVLVQTLLDNLVMGSFSLIYTPAMLVGWLSLVLILWIFRNVKNRGIIATIVGLHGFIYSWCFLIVRVFIYNTPLLPYFIADLPFELILVFNGFITTFILLKPLTMTLNKLQNKREN